jgi:hypothetical protein
MASMATDQPSASKKPESHDANDAKDAKDPSAAHKSEVGRGPADKAKPAPPKSRPEPLDSAVDDPYDNVACTD